MKAHRPSRLMMPAFVFLACLAGEARAFGPWPTRDPQVSFASAGVQATLDEWVPGRDAAANQVDAPVIGPLGLGDAVVGVIEPVSVEFGIYAADQAGNPYLVPLFRPGSPLDQGYRRVVFRGSAGTAWFLAFDLDGTFQGTQSFPWPAGAARIGLYVSGPGGTWYSEDDRNAGVAHVVAYANQPATAPELLVFFETGPSGAGQAATFTGVKAWLYEYFCEPYPNSCGPVAASRSTWGGLKLRYR